MVIDAHTHILPPSFPGRIAELRRRDRTMATLFARDGAKMATAEGLVAAMDTAGVDAAAAAGYGWSDAGLARESNDYILESAARFPGRILPFCSVNPAWGADAVGEVERCAAAGAVGVGELHFSTQGVRIPDGEGLAEVMEAARRLNLPVLLHGSEPVGHTYDGKGDTGPARLLAMGEAYPDNVFIFAHWGGGLPFYALMPEVCEALRNVYFDSAATLLLYGGDVFSVAAQAAGIDRVLFASDYPLLDQGEVIAQARDALGAQAHQALHANAARLFGIAG